MKYIVIIMVLLIPSFVLKAHVIALDMNSIKHQYHSYVDLNESVIKSIFLGKYCEKAFIYNSVNKTPTDSNILNINDFTFKYKPFCAIKSKELRDDTLFCEISIDMYQFPSLIFIYKNNELIMHMEGISGGLTINNINNISKKTYSCITNDTNNIVLDVCNLKETLRINIDENEVNSSSCPNDISTGTYYIEQNKISDYFFKMILKLPENDSCIPKIIYESLPGLRLDPNIFK